MAYQSTSKDVQSMPIYAEVSCIQLSATYFRFPRKYRFPNCKEIPGSEHIIDLTTAIMCFGAEFFVTDSSPNLQQKRLADWGVNTKIGAYAVI
jgi:hypothetical protein